jgi:hypothetical protein
MKNEIVADGPTRLLDAQMAERRALAQKQFADEWARANFFKRIQLRYQIWREVLNGKSSHKPSPKTLW